MPKTSDINLVLIHGYGETPDKVWFPWIHRKAEDKGWRVWAPFMPNPLKPEYAVWMKIVQTMAKKWDRNTVIIGHSLGGVLAIRALEKSGVKVKALITVAAPFSSTVAVRQVIAFFNQKINWSALRRQAKRFVTIHSKNDPLVPYDHAYRYQEVLGSKLVFAPQKNHFIGKQAKVVWEELEKIARL